MRRNSVGSQPGEGPVEFIRSAILSGSYAPGERLKEAEVAVRLGVSRTPVREAFRVLETEGLIEVLAGRGARVRLFTAEDVQLIHEIRSVLEGMVARQATLHVSKSHLAALESSCDRLENLPDGSVLECDQENQYFHGLIFDIVGNDRLTHIARRLLEVPLPYKEDYWSTEEVKASSVAAHRRVCEALRTNDAVAAEEAMRQHVRDAGAGVARNAKLHPAGTSPAG
nr:GntR family transcriptional regulator [Arthrobacter sp. 260]